MANINELEIRKDLERKKLRPIYYFYGKEQFKVREYLSSIVSIIEGDGSSELSKELYFGDELKADDLLAACQSISLFQSEKLIIVKNADAISAKSWLPLKSIIETPPESTTLVFAGESIDLRKKHSQWLTKAGKDVAVVKCEPIKEKEIFSWAKTLAQRHGKKVHAAGINLLLELSGTSLYELNQTLEKAAIYAGKSATISPEHIEAVSVRTKLEIIFGFTDAVLGRERARALELVGNLYEQGEEPIAIVGLLGRQYRWMLEIATRQANRESFELVTKSLGLYSRTSRTLWNGAKQRGSEAIRCGMQMITEADYKLKSSAVPPRLVLDQLTVRLVGDLA